MIAGLGVSWCFFANGVSYSAAVLAFMAMRENEFFAVEPVPKRKGQLREGLRYDAGRHRRCDWSSCSRR